MRVKIEQSKKLYHIDGSEYLGAMLEVTNGINVTTDYKHVFIPYEQINRIETLFGVDDTEDDS